MGRRRRKAKAKPTKRLTTPPPPQPPPDPSKCYLLTRLPPELRHTISKLVLPPPTLLNPRVSTLFRAAELRELSRKRFRTHEKVLGLARCCKQLFEEVVPIYYGENRFSFGNAYDLYRFLFMIGYERRRWIRSIDFFLVGGFQYGSKTMKNSEVFQLAFDVLADCTLLRHLYIGVSFNTTDGIPSKRERDLFAVREWGVFDAVRGMEGLNLRVREVGEYWQESLDEESRKNVFEGGVELSWLGPRRLFFREKLVKEFERALMEDFERPKFEEDDQDDEERDEIDEEDMDDGSGDEGEEKEEEEIKDDVPDEMVVKHKVGTQPRVSAERGTKAKRCAPPSSTVTKRQRT